MAKTRLCDWKRRDLKDLARKLVECPKEAAATERAYATAEPLVRATVEKIYPPIDMAVCAKYKAAHVDDCIKVKDTLHDITLFVFEKHTGPLVTQPTYSGKIYEIDAKTTKAVGRWNTATKAHKEAVKAKLGDYNALIATARTFEDVAEVWPEADILRDKLCNPGTALVTLTPGVVTRIKKDVAQRQKNAA